MNNITPRKPSGAPIGNKNAVRLNPKVRAVAAILLTEPDITVEAACERAQCPRSTFYQAERSEAYQAYLQSLSRTRLRTRIAAKAMHRYERLIDAQSEYVAADISKDALSQIGVREKLDHGQRAAGIGSITINIGPRPSGTVRIEANLDDQPPPSGQEPDER